MSWVTRILPGRSSRVAALALASVLAIAGCSGSDGQQVASAEGGAGVASSAAPSESLAGDYEEQRLAFAQCMRDNGVPMADPGTNSGPGTGLRDLEGVDPDVLDAALTACEEFRATSGGGTAADISDADKQKMLDVAQCLRDSGYPVADPTFDGRGGYFRPDPSSGLDARDEEFRAALEQCSTEAGWTGLGGRRTASASPSPSTTGA